MNPPERARVWLRCIVHDVRYLSRSPESLAHTAARGCEVENETAGSLAQTEDATQ